MPYPSLLTLAELVCKPGLNLDGEAITRQAVRAIVRDVDIPTSLLMVYSTVNGDYKFPGGGIEPGETDAQALARELAEECGAPTAVIGEPLGQVIEYDRPTSPGFDIFKMTSRYYFCRIPLTLGPQKLDGYEHRLGFRPQWVDIRRAIHTNQAVLQSPLRTPPRWTRRDTLVLQLLLDSLDKIDL
jgi:8-oxo-dGTP pyrophosphatase MutT (NUDIX family)